MNRTAKLIGAALGGVGAGLALAFILCAATSVIAISTGSPTSLPGVFAATAGSENGALSLEFQPNLFGIAAVVCLTALASVVVAARGNSASRGPSER